MMNTNHTHWENIYSDPSRSVFTWTQKSPDASLRLLGLVPEDLRHAAVMDAGGGDGALVPALLDKGYSQLSLLDISEAALERTRARLGERAAAVRLIQADLMRYRPDQSYAVWHDRAVFHFLQTAHEKQTYLSLLRQALPPGAHLIVGAFSTHGPSSCSGLKVQQYDLEGLCEAFGSLFDFVSGLTEDHVGPQGQVQNFIYALFRRRADGAMPAHRMEAMAGLLSADQTDQADAGPHCALDGNACCCG